MRTQVCCKRCQHRWFPRITGRPKQCPGCKATQWDMAVVRMIYAIYDPVIMQYVYVGQTRSPLQRYMAHSAGSTGTNNRALTAYCRRLREEGSPLYMTLLEAIDVAKVHARERWWILHLLKLGHPLLNVKPMGGAYQQAASFT